MASCMTGNACGILHLRDELQLRALLMHADELRMDPAFHLQPIITEARVACLTATVESCPTNIVHVL